MAGSNKPRTVITAVIVVALSAGQYTSAKTAAEQGLAVRNDGVSLKDGRPYRGIGVNYFDALARTLKDQEDTSYEAGFRVLAEQTGDTRHPQRP